MKRDWTKPQMRLQPRDVASDLFSFLLFLRLGVVTLFCFLGLPVIIKQAGAATGFFVCLIAVPLWWYHFGLPRFSEQRSGFFSAKFCLWGYIAVTAYLVVDVLEWFGILKEAHS
jgi:hypothetical protein